MKDEKKKICANGRGRHTHTELCGTYAGTQVSLPMHIHTTHCEVSWFKRVSLYMSHCECVTPSSSGHHQFAVVVIFPAAIDCCCCPYQSDNIYRRTKPISFCVPLARFNRNKRQSSGSSSKKKNCGITELQIANVCVTIDCLRWAVVVKPAAATSHHTTDNRCQCTSTYNHYECVAGADLCMNQMALERKIEKKYI